MEKYGVIPPRFTKEWWKYFWDYYKIHTIAGVSAVVLIGSTAVQCARAPKYDLSILYVNPSEVSQETSDSFTSAVSQSINDATSDNEILTFIQSLPLASMEAKDEESYAMATKLTLELQAGENWLFIASEDVAKALISSESFSDCFMTLNELDIQADDDIILKSDTGAEYGINLTNNEFLKSTGLNTNNTYMLIRRLYERESGKEKNVNLYQNAIDAAKRIAQG